MGKEMTTQAPIDCRQELTDGSNHTMMTMPHENRFAAPKAMLKKESS